MNTVQNTLHAIQSIVHPQPDEPPYSFICPITNDIITDPVIDKHGHTFEKIALIEWLKTKTICPMNNQPINSDELVPNRALKEMIKLYQAQRFQPIPSKIGEKNGRSQNEAPLFDKEKLHLSDHKDDRANIKISKMMEEKNKTNSLTQSRSLLFGIGQSIERAKVRQLLIGRQDSEALWMLGSCYMYGYKTENGAVIKDAKQAFKYFEKSYQLDQHPYSGFELAACFMLGTGIKKDPVQAYALFKSCFEDLQKLANLGDAIAQCYLGIFYKNGCGVAPDLTQAVFWWRKSSDQEVAAAQTSLGLCYLRDNGMEQDYIEAVSLFTKAADKEYAEAQYILGDCYDRGSFGVFNDEKAKLWLTKAANQGHALAQYRLAEMYYCCEAQEDKQLLEQAVFWFRKAADQDNYYAICRLGDCYYKGLGVSQDFQQAVYWYEKGSKNWDKKGIPASVGTYRIGECYLYGQGVDKNEKQALFWFTKSQEEGNVHASSMIEQIKDATRD